jgi:hypothetical protein
MHLINDLSLENKFSRIEIALDSNTSNPRNFLDGSYFTETELKKDINRSKSRSIPRTTEILSNIKYGGEENILSPKSSRN